ncbi:hypothetical protein [Burkholderia stabilis]|uniref:hypothetical protein n=1 Tax=Burkholderia stabilis TaxID=95485 RepID=UPI0013E99BF9|nr:hypothetical protein [Burkholderia stabilis]
MFVSAAGISAPLCGCRRSPGNGPIPLSDRFPFIAERNVRYPPESNNRLIGRIAAPACVSARHAKVMNRVYDRA